MGASEVLPLQNVGRKGFSHNESEAGHKLFLRGFNMGP